MDMYRVRLTRLIEQETCIDVVAPTAELAAESALDRVHDDLVWIDSGCEYSHAVDDIVPLADVVAADLGQFEAAAFARDQRLQRPDQTGE